MREYCLDVIKIGGPLHQMDSFPFAYLDNASEDAWIVVTPL